MADVSPLLTAAWAFGIAALAVLLAFTLAVMASVVHRDRASFVLMVVAWVLFGGCAGGVLGFLILWAVT